MNKKKKGYRSRERPQPGNKSTPISVDQYVKEIGEITATLPVGLFTGNQLPAFIMDGFSNVMARLGDNSGNIMEHTEYNMTRISRDYNTLNALYRTNWVVKRLIDVVPEDMLKNWYKINSQIDLDAQRKLTRLERTSQLRAKILEGLKWGRLYGGAAGLIVIDGHDDILDEPLTLDMVMPDSFKGLIILDRWSGVTSGLEIVKDYNDPDFGLPEYYQVFDESIVDGAGIGIKIHHSRIIRFTGRDLPYLERLGEQYWGASELEHVFDELKKRDNTSWNIASLVFRANLNVFKMEGMEKIALMPEARLNDLYDTLTALNAMMNNQGMQVIGSKDSVEQHQYSFAGLSDIYELFMLDIAGAAEIPVTKLFGRSPAGMNATGESDMQNYADSIEEKQESTLRPVMDKLLPIMCMSAYGAVPDDLDYDFVNVRRPTEAERKNLAKSVGDSVVSVHGAGIINQKIALSELKASTELTGMWQSITDEDIENADTTFMGGDMPEVPGFHGVEQPGASENAGNEDTADNKPSRFREAIYKAFRRFNKAKKKDTGNFNMPSAVLGASDGGRFTRDDEWVTINGAKVLIGEDGQIKAGMGGKHTGKTVAEAAQSKNKLQQQHKSGNVKYTQQQKNVETAVLKARTEPPNYFELSGRNPAFPANYSVTGFSHPRTLEEHMKHADGVGAVNEKDYAAKAKTFIESPLGDTGDVFVTSSGKIYKYDNVTKHLAIAYPNGTLGTYWNLGADKAPHKADAYWEGLKRKHKEEYS